MARTGRRPGGTATRERIAEAARAEFAARGLDGSTIRAIAAMARVDPALVHHYFGTKEQLFVSVMQLPLDHIRAVTGMVAAGEAEIGHRLARFALESWERPEFREVVLGLIRSAASDAQAAAMLRDVLLRQGLPELVRALGGSDPVLRAELVGSQLVGLAMARFVLRIEPLASADVDTLAAAVGPTLQRYLTGDIGPVRRGD